MSKKVRLQFANLLIISSFMAKAKNKILMISKDNVTEKRNGGAYVGT